MTRPQPRFTRLLLTGAGGTLGRHLNAALAPLTHELLLSDLPVPTPQQQPAEGWPALPPPPPNARWQHCDLADRDAVRALLHGVDAVVHFGGVSYEKPFDVVLPANIVGVFNLYEAARLAGTKRIVLASSNHVTGCYPQVQTISPADPPRPDGYYGLSKLFGEGLASLYWDRWGIESVCLRIGTAVPEPTSRRSLSSWLSLPDLARLVTASLTTPGVGFTVAYGMSANTRAWWTTQEAWQRIGFQPQDNAEAWAAAVQHVELPAGPQRELQGGTFLGIGPFDEATTPRK